MLITISAAAGGLVSLLFLIRYVVRPCRRAYRWIWWTTAATKCLLDVQTQLVRRIGTGVSVPVTELWRARTVDRLRALSRAFPDGQDEEDEAV